MHSSSNIEDTLSHHCKFGTKPKPGLGQRQHQVHLLQNTLGSRSLGRVNGTGRTFIANMTVWVEEKPAWTRMASTLPKRSTSYTNESYVNLCCCLEGI